MPNPASNADEASGAVPSSRPDAVMTDKTGKAAPSAFDQGQIAGKSVAPASVENPFPAGSAQHNNFEVGRRFAVAHSRPSPVPMVADADEEEN